MIRAWLLEGVPKEVFAAPRTPELQPFVGTMG
jgi:hypothetical protein